MVMSKRERNIGIICGVVLGILILDRMMIQPLFDRMKELDAPDTGLLAQAQQQLTAATRTMDTGKRADDAWKRMMGSQQLLREESGAESQMLNSVQQWGQGSGLNINSQRREKIERNGDFMVMTYRVTGAGTMSQVARFLYNVQNANIPVRITDFTLSSKKEGADDLTVSAAVATLYFSPEPDKNQRGGSSSAGAGWEMRP